MITKEIEILKIYNEGVSFLEAVKLAGTKRLISNKEADAILQNEEEYKKYKGLFYCWTGTIIIYEQSGKPFGEFVKDSSTGWIIDIPKKYQGKTNCVLVIEHPDFKIKKGKYDMTFLVPDKESDIKLLSDFPSEDDWYIQDKEFGIPQDKIVKPSDKEARYLYRRSESSLCPLVRYDDVFDLRRFVDAIGSPDDDRLGVGVVEPQHETK